jgi:hypothetical protein
MRIDFESFLKSVDRFTVTRLFRQREPASTKAATASSSCLSATYAFASFK